MSTIAIHAARALVLTLVLSGCADPRTGPRFRKIEFSGDAGGRPMTLLREPKLD